MHRATIILGVVAAALLVACGTSANGAEPSPTSTPAPTPAPTEIVDPNSLADRQAALDAARALWAASGGDDYDMTFNWQCFCIVDYVQRVDLEVRGGSVEDGTVTESGIQLTPEQLAEYVSVEQLFDLIQDAIDQDAAEIRVSYAAAGYPTEVWIDFNLRIADEERGFFIHDLTIV